MAEYKTYKGVSSGSPSQVDPQWLIIEPNEFLLFNKIQGPR